MGSRSARGSGAWRASRGLFGNSCPYVLVALAAGEMGVMEVVRATGLSYTTVRRCIERLSMLGLVSRRSVGGSRPRYLYFATEQGIEVALYLAGIICELDDDISACIRMDSLLGYHVSWGSSDIDDEYMDCARRFN